MPGLNAENAAFSLQNNTQYACEWPMQPCEAAFDSVYVKAMALTALDESG